MIIQSFASYAFFIKCISLVNSKTNYVHTNCIYIKETESSVNITLIYGQTIYYHGKKGKKTENPQVDLGSINIKHYSHKR